MGMRNGRHSKCMSIFMIVLLLLSLVFPAGAMAKPQASTTNQIGKLQQELVEAFKEKDKVRFIVILEKQLQTENISKQVEMKAATQKLKPTELKMEKGKAITAALQKNATETQKDVLKQISKQQKSGDIDKLRSFYILNAIAVEGTKKAAEALIAMPEVKEVVLDEQRELSPPEKVENKKDKQLADDEIEWNVSQVGIPEVWEQGYDGEGMVVANIDSGVDWLHPAVKRQYRGYNPDDPDNADHEFNWHDAVMDRQSPMDSDGHGTHTMGTMVGQEADGTNKIGAAPGAKWIAVRAFWGDTGYDSDILEAGEWVLAPTDNEGVPHPEKAPDIVNNSWGGNPYDNDWFRPMVQAWRDAGIVPIFSVGNAGLFSKATPGSASAPGNYPESIAVGATDQENQLASFSLRGPSENGDVKPDLAAPGVGIRSSVPGETWDQFEYDFFNGTSMAAPLVSGIALLMLQADPSLTVDQIDSILKWTADEKTDETYTETPNNGYGFGIVNAPAAVEAAANGVGSIHGQIISEQEDNKPPQYEHHERRVVFTNEDAHFSITAADDVSVEEVTLHLTIDQGKEETFRTNRVDGDHQEGIYEAIIPGERVVGDDLSYWWTIKDFYGNETITDTYDVSIEEGISAGYTEDFELYPDGWYAFGRYNSWEWGAPLFGPDQAASGDKVMGTHLRGNYKMDADMSLMMPPVLVEEDTVLRFKQWYSLSWFGEDVGTVFLSEDGENWTQLYQISKDNENWHEAGIDLSDYAGKKVYIAFNLLTRDNEFPGWYIDDVKLVREGGGNGAVQPEDRNNTQKLADSAIQYPIEQSHKIQKSKGTLPVNANIEVVETGWTTTTNPQDGSFAIYHEPGTYTLSIEAYGYKHTTKQISIESKGEATPVFQLEPLSSQKISGTVTDSFGNPIANAVIQLSDDELAANASSDNAGIYELSALEGDHTVIVRAPGYQSVSKQITVEAGEDIALDINMDSYFRGEDKEISYDNGSYGKNLAMGKKGNGFAVRMSLDEEKGAAMLTGAKLQFWAAHVPVPGGEAIEIAIYDADGEDGSPGTKLAGPVKAKAKRDLNQWTEVDLSDLGLLLDGDFYIVYLQVDDFPYVPGFVSDGDANQAAGRSWDYLGGNWYQAEDSLGNYMIRASVAYSEDAPNMKTPVISSPSTGIYTNEAELNIAGEAEPSATLRLLNNGKQIGTFQADESGAFSYQSKLEEGNNKLSVVSFYKGSPVNVSKTIDVVLDSIKPKLTIESPKDGTTTKNSEIVVEGKVTDENLKIVTVNDKEVNVQEEHYSTPVALTEGENQIVVVAKDLAGNEQSKTVMVIYQDIVPEITNVQPKKDQYLLAGDEVKISFESTVEGGEANFLIKLPTGQANKLEADSTNMKEVKSGKYEGTWVVPANTNIQDAMIEVELKDQDGLKLQAIAEGKLHVAKESINRIAGDIRYDTAVEISKTGWAKADTVILARGDEFADSLAGVPLGHALDAPILLTPSDKMWSTTKDEIKRLQAKNVIILGGEKAVSNQIEADLKKQGLSVKRIAGDTRFETAAYIADELAPNGTKQAVVANGMDFPDALSVAAHAAKEGLPILLTRPDVLPKGTEAAIKKLGLRETIVVGGPQVVHEKIANQLPAVKRLHGHDRYGTNIAIAKHFGVENKHQYVATGKEYADALTGAVLAAKQDSGIILVHHRVPKDTAPYIQEEQVKFLSVFGGEVAVSKEVFAALKELLQ
ncbi:S8 family serine peptidase [Ornithinibacillus gellani]|uniref:S8 family serine peptidase n=1 Tax=Ornithinibacillus gellani TaxID=2293253 RepID=UPI0016814911|nr:S8 family serine peptidase [Ornithinibacillus gellani]